MKITRVDVYGYELHYVHGEYVMSGGRAARTQSSTLVRLSTDEGVEGWGEVCPLAGTYVPAFARGVRAGLAELAPVLIERDPTNLAEINAAMDGTLLGQAAAKSPLDIACWDILGKVTATPAVTLLGGQMREGFPLYKAVPLGTVEQTGEFVRARWDEGIRHFQLKVGGDPREDAARTERALQMTGGDGVVVADANGGWSLNDALIAVRALDQLPHVYLEQPCRTLAECAQVRKVTSLPMVYDESVIDPESLVAAVQEGGAGAVNAKLSKLGGLTRAKLVRDLAQDLGVELTIEDTWGGDVTTAAVSHLAASTHPSALFTVSFFNDWTTEHVAGYQPRSVGGVGTPPDGPGLGIEVNVGGLGEPLFSIE